MATWKGHSKHVTLFASLSLPLHLINSVSEWEARLFFFSVSVEQDGVNELGFHLMIN